MNTRAVVHIISFLVLLVGLALAASWGLSWLLDDPVSARQALGISALAAFAAGGLIHLATRGHYDLTWRDGIAVGTFGWLAVSVFGALPYVLSGAIRDPVAALFEAVSGFTTTGASVIAEVEPVAKGILLWRALTHFLGGMGVLVLCVAILPFLGTGGMRLYRAEVAGPSKDRLTPRITSTAKLLWMVYVLLCAVEIVLLRLGGMSWFDSVCHSFATIATGGFSTRSVSIAAYNSLYIEIVLTVFMLIGATNFALHYRAMRGEKPGYLRNAEFRFFLGAWLIACAIVTFNTWRTVYPDLGSALRNSVFSVTSLSTTTGFATADFDRWPATSKLVLLVAMVFGGCVGSTAGGVKHMRILVTFKKIICQTKVFMHPNAVVQVKMDGQAIDDKDVGEILGYVTLYIIALAAASVILSSFTRDMVSAVSAVIATTGGVGPGLGLVGPLQNYATIPAGGKAVLILCMLFGRLEFYTLLALLFPSFWKK